MTSSNSDRDKFKRLLQEFGVEFTEKDCSIICEEGSKKVAGYSGFVTEFTFDADGKFVEMGAYE